MEPAPLTTARLRVRALTLADAPFIVRLLNDPAFIRNIGDRHVRTEEEARAYLTEGPRASYARHGFGLCAVELAEGQAPIGICGLLQRAELPAPDIGFAYLPEYRSQGYAFEAGAAVTGHAHGALGIRTLLAIVSPDNTPSVRLLERLGFQFDGMFRSSPEAKELKLYASRV